MAARARLVTAAPTEGTGKNRASPPSHHLSIQNRWRLDLPREVCRSSSRDSCSLRLRFALTRHKDGALAKQITLPELRSTSLEGGSFPLDAPPYDLPRGEVGRSLYLRQDLRAARMLRLPRAVLASRLRCGRSGTLAGFRV